MENQLSIFDYLKEDKMPKIRFNGPEYVPARDDVRLTGQIKRVFGVMKNSDWITVAEISDITGDPQTSISAQIRHLRKERFGGFDIPARRRNDSSLYEYKLLDNS